MSLPREKGVKGRSREGEFHVSEAKEGVSGRSKFELLIVPSHLTSLSISINNLELIIYYYIFYQLLLCK